MLENGMAIFISIYSFMFFTSFYFFFVFYKEQ